MSKKLILNAQYGSAIKFKIPFDTQNDTATIEDLKRAILQRLEKLTQNMPPEARAKLPEDFSPDGFILQDANKFQLDETDLVTDLLQPNDLIDLIDRVDLNKSIAQSLSQTYIQNASFMNQLLVTQTSIQPQDAQDVPQPQFPNPFKAPLLPPEPQPQQSQNPPQVMPIQDPQPQSVQPQAQIPIEPQDVGVVIKKLQDQFYLNISPLRNSQQMVTDSEYKLLLTFPQSIDPSETFVFYSEKDITLLELSNKLAKSLGYGDDVTFVFANSQGHTIHDSMEAVHYLTVEESIGLTYPYNNKYYVFATRCNRGSKRLPKVNHEEGTHQIFVNHNGTKVINVNIETDSVQILKQKIYSKINVPPNSQCLSYGGKSLADGNLLIDYNIQNNSNIILLYKPSDLVPQASSYSYNFYSPWNQFFVSQSDAGLRQFRSHLFALCSHLDATQQLRFLGLVRDLSINNAPMVLTLRNLTGRNRLTQMQKIVLEEGLLFLFMTMILNSNDIPSTLALNTVFEFSRHCFASLLNSSAKPVDIPSNWTKQEHYRVVDNNCSVTGKQIVIPALLQTAQDQNENKFLVVDFDTVKEKQKNKDKFNNLQIDEMSLTQPKWLLEQFNFMRASKDLICWVPTQDYQPSKETEALVIFSIAWHTVVDPHPGNPIKIYSSMELKQHPSTPVLTLNSKKELVLYTSMNKDVRKPYNLFDVMSGAEIPENPDDIAYSNLAGINGRGRKSSTPGNDDEEPEIKIEPLITVTPDEAIIVILDISGSMEEQFYDSEGLQRIGAVKAFFNAFADRTMAYNLKHVIALAFFDDRYELKCTFTEVFAQFKDLVNRAKPRGMTALYDALMTSSDSLQQIKTKYPDCLLRIIALTDGEDNKSTHKPHEAALKIAANGIILDSFVAGPKSDSLKQIAHTTGGKCFCPKDLNEGLKYFEYETILSAKCRVPSKPLKQHQLMSIKSVLASNKNKPYDVKAHEIKVPDQMQKQSVNPVQLVNSLSQDANKFQQVAPNQSLKRVVKEMTSYLKDPHPYIKIFPCEDDISFWKVILLGPEETPYQKGVFTLYIHFSESYPLAAPRFRFFTPIYHCNINQQGRICHSILDRNYTPDTTVKQIFECIYGLLMTPEPDDPLDNTIASEYLQDLPLYRKKAQEHMAQHAQKPLDEVMKAILGSGNSSIQQSDEVLHEKIEELQKWIQDSINKQQQQQQ